MRSAPKTRGHRVFYLAPPWPEAGGETLLPKAETRHAAGAMRVRRGEALQLVDGQGNRAAATALGMSRGRLKVRLGEASPSRSEQRLAGRLALPLIRLPSRLDWAIEKGTELGAVAFDLFVADRCVKDSAGRSEVKCERWRRVAKAAMKQCGRAFWPPVRLHDDLEDLLAEMAQAKLLVADPGGAPFSESGWEPGPPEERLLLVGPEGGWSQREERLLAGRAALRIGLGPRRLRVETAAVVLCALVGETTGAQRIRGAQ